MMVRELILLDSAYESKIATVAINRLSKVKLGFRLSDSLMKNSEIVDGLVFNEIVKANKVLAPSSEVRIPTWTTKAEFDSFIAKIMQICN